MDVFDRMRQFEILSHFTDHQIDQLANCTSRVSYDQATVILEEGDDSRDIYLIDLGEVDIRRNTPYGRYALARLEPGDLFGEASFIDESARSGDVVACSEVVVFPINRWLDGTVGVDNVTDRLQSDLGDPTTDFNWGPLVGRAFRVGLRFHLDGRR